MTGVPLLLGLLNALTPGASALPASYATMDEAAVAFVELARTYSDQKKEYCAWLIKGADGRVFIGPSGEGDMDKCKSQWPKPAGTVGSVHTHPIWGPGSKAIDAPGQAFSEGDFDFAENAGVLVPLYLGAPAGHVLRYDLGGSLCVRKSFITRNFKVVRDLKPGVSDRLPLKSGKKVALYDLAGKPIPRPPYCKEDTR